MPVNYSAPWEAFRGGFEAYGQVVDDQRQRALLEAEQARWQQQMEIAKAQEARRAKEEAAMAAWKSEYDALLNFYPENPELALRESLRFMPAPEALKTAQTEGAEQLKRDIQDQINQRLMYGTDARLFGTMYGADARRSIAEDQLQLGYDRLYSANEQKELDRLSKESMPAIQEAAKATGLKDVGTVTDPKTGETLGVTLHVSPNKYQFIQTNLKLSEAAKPELQELVAAKVTWENMLVTEKDPTKRVDIRSRIEAIRSRIRALTGSRRGEPIDVPVGVNPPASIVAPPVPPMPATNAAPVVPPPTADTGSPWDTMNAEPPAQSLDERVVVVDKNGKKFTVPRRQLDQAIAAGYRQP